ncbi:MAG: hypothetical protein J1E65_08120 [Lachnospiraceae bacterium]|nr:hypothetical protein [Lachnospiraceae bacterium]
MKYMTIGLKRKVSFALLPIDDFTGQIITGSQLRACLREENKSSIRKPDGYHIFCDLSGSEAEVCLEGPLYQKQILRLPIGQEAAKVYQVRMLPKRGYPFPQGTTIVSGVLPKGSMIRMFFPKKKKGCKLLYDYDPGIQGKELSLFRPSKMYLGGKTMCICGQKEDLEFFRISDQREDICILEQPLSKVYQKSGTGVYPVYEAAAGVAGSFYLPIGGLREEEICICILIGADGKEKICQVELMTGRENRITKDMWKEEC